MRAFAVLLLAVALSTVSAGGVSQQDLFQTVLFHHGDNGINTYRIPALVQSRNGTLIAIADARYPNANDLPNHIALAMRRSFDHGNHWTPIRLILDPDQGGVGDASLLLDRSTGRIWCFHSYGPPGIGFHTATAGELTGPHTQQLHAMYTDDDGETWSTPVDITPQVKDRSWQAMFATSGTDIQTSSGRLLVPIVVKDAAGIIHSANIFSDDHGKTWKRGEFIGEGTDESHNVELAGGVILQNMRSGMTRSVALSHDGGITFGPVMRDPALIDPNCNAGFLHYNHAGRNVLVFTNDAGTTRTNLTVKISTDQGRTWPQARTLNAGPSAYSTVIQLNTGDVGILYEHGITSPYEEISFARLPLAWTSQPAAPAR